MLGLAHTNLNQMADNDTQVPPQTQTKALVTPASHISISDKSICSEDNDLIAENVIDQQEVFVFAVERANIAVRNLFPNAIKLEHILLQAGRCASPLILHIPAVLFRIFRRRN